MDDNHYLPSIAPPLWSTPTMLASSLSPFRFAQGSTKDEAHHSARPSLPEVLSDCAFIPTPEGFFVRLAEKEGRRIEANASVFSTPF